MLKECNRKGLKKRRRRGDYIRKTGMIKKKAAKKEKETYK
jgi:hypothetical protein